MHKEHCSKEDNTNLGANPKVRKTQNSEFSNSLTFQLADLRLTVRPLVVTVHFILMKKSLSALISLPFLSKPFPRAVKFDTVR